MSARRRSWLIILSGVLLIIGPPLFVDNLQSLYPVLFIAVLLIVIGVGQRLSERFASVSQTVMHTVIELGSDQSSGSMASERELADDYSSPSDRRTATEQSNTALREALLSKSRPGVHFTAETQRVSYDAGGVRHRTPVQRPPDSPPALKPGSLREQGKPPTARVRSIVSTVMKRGAIPRAMHSIIGKPTAAEASAAGSKAAPHALSYNETAYDAEPAASNDVNNSSDTRSIEKSDVENASKAAGLFDMDPEELKAHIMQRLQDALLELFDVEPEAVKAAIAKMMESDLESLFDIDPESIKAAIADLMEKRLLDLFDIDPIVIHQALAARGDDELAALFDTEPEVLKATIVAILESRIAELFDIEPSEVKTLLAARQAEWEAALFDTDPALVKQALAELIDAMLFDIDPDIVRQALAAFGEEELLELFDADPELVKTALKLRYSEDVLELFDNDPAALRATFAWRQKDNLSELFDADPEALRALWEAQKAEPLHAEEAIRAQETLKAISRTQLELVISEHKDLLEMLSQPSMGLLRQRNTERKRLIASDSDGGSRVSLEYLRRQVAARIVEDRILSLEVQRSALQGVLSENRLNDSQRAILLGEVSRRLTSARTHAIQLRQQAREQLYKDRMAEQEAAFRASRKPTGSLDEAARERMRQRMLKDRRT